MRLRGDWVVIEGFGRREEAASYPAINNFRRLDLHAYLESRRPSTFAGNLLSEVLAQAKSTFGAFTTSFFRRSGFSLLNISSPDSVLRSHCQHVVTGAVL